MFERVQIRGMNGTRRYLSIFWVEQFAKLLFLFGIDIQWHIKNNTDIDVDVFPVKCEANFMLSFIHPNDMSISKGKQIWINGCPPSSL